MSFLTPRVKSFMKGVDYLYGGLWSDNGAFALGDLSRKYH